MFLQPAAADAGITVPITRPHSTTFVAGGSISLLQRPASVWPRGVGRERGKRRSQRPDIRRDGRTEPVPLRNPTRVVVGQPDLAGLILVYQRLQRQIDPSPFPPLPHSLP